MPAENAAIDRKVHPKAWTYDNIAAMKKQLQSMGLSLDWAREIATCDPAYYKHQQKMFLDFLKAGWSSASNPRSTGIPSTRRCLPTSRSSTDAAGAPAPRRATRTDAVVFQDQRLLGRSSGGARQARSLAGQSSSDAEELDRSIEGLLLRFALDPATTPNKETELEIFTTRPDTLFGAKFMALSPDHPLATAAAAKNPKLAAFIEQCHRMGTAQAEIDTAEKLGFDTGMKAVHPFDANWKLPVYVANFILMDYGTGRHFRLSGARPARPRLRQQIRSRQYAGRLPAEPGSEDLRHHRRCL
jgi:leucyl-tRNA synthetase